MPFEFNPSTGNIKTDTAEEALKLATTLKNKALLMVKYSKQGENDEWETSKSVSEIDFETGEVKELETSPTDSVFSKIKSNVPATATKKSSSVVKIPYEKLNKQTQKFIKLLKGRVKGVHRSEVARRLGCTTRNLGRECQLIMADCKQAGMHKPYEISGDRYYPVGIPLD